MKEKRVLHLFATMGRGGAETRTIELYRSLRRAGFPLKMDFFMTTEIPGALDSDIVELGGTIYRSTLAQNPVASLLALRRQLQTGHYDIVHSHLHLFSGVILAIAAAQRVPTRIAHFRSVHDGAAHTLRRRLYRALMRRLIALSATHIVGVSSAALADTYGVPEDNKRHFVVYNGLDLAPFRREVTREAIRQAMGWDDEPVLIHVGRFVVPKNHETILETAAQFQREGFPARFVLVGHGRLQAEIEGKIRQTGLTGTVTSLGERDDVPRLLLASDAFFLPSLWEGLPGALLEAMAAGLPAVASDIEPVREIACHFPSRIFMAGPKEVEQHAANIRLALARGSLPPEVAIDQFRQTPFSIEKVIAQMMGIYGMEET